MRLFYFEMLNQAVCADVYLESGGQRFYWRKHQAFFFIIDLLPVNLCNKLRIKSQIQMREKSLNCVKTDTISLSLLELQAGGKRRER